MAGLRGRHGHRPPRLRTPVPADVMSSPRLGPWTLVTPGSQVLVTWTWRTVDRILPCQMVAAHGPMCSRFVLDGEESGTHADVRMDVWIRHPVTGGRP